MSDNIGYVAGVEREKFIDFVGLKFKELFPHVGLFPNTKITIGAGESPDGEKVQAQILFTMSRKESIDYFMPDEDMKDVMEVMKPTMLVLGDERVKDGLFVLHSSVEQNMICIKFATKAEAFSYRSFFDLSQYSVVKTKMGISYHPWFTGEDMQKEAPWNVGYLDIDQRTVKGGA